MLRHDEIKEICDKYNIRNWSLNEETGLVDVDGNVDLYLYNLTELPLNFGNVNGGFLCDSNELTTLKGAPISVGDTFVCTNNTFLTTLKGLPKHVGGNFYCQHNTNLSTWEHRWILYAVINGEIYANNENLERFLNKHKNPPKSELPKLFAELKKLGKI